MTYLMYIKDMKHLQQKFNSLASATLTTTVVCIAVSGCMVGPDYKRPPTTTDAVSGYIYAGKHSQDVNDINTVGCWWERFGDPTTTQLVKQALENNYDLKASAARVLQAQAALAEAEGSRLPEISAVFNRTMTRTNTFPPGAYSPFGSLESEVIKTRTYTPEFSISYVLDLFGKLRRLEQAAWADMLAAKANEQALTNSLIASVINARTNIATLQRQLAITRANTENWIRNLEIIERRYGRGLVGPLDVRLARENLEASKASEATVELSLIKAQNALDVLLGRQPGLSRNLSQTLPELPDLTPVPIGVPAMLLDRRPDVMAAEMALKSSNEKIGVSIAQLFPDLTLTGGIGWKSNKSDDIFVNEAWVYSMVFNAIQPIFKGGQLIAQVDAAKARNAELAADYASTVLNALREVEDALAREQLLQKRLNALQLRFSEAVAAEKLARERYLQGIDQLIIVLETERRRRIAEDALNLVKGEIWNSRTNLFLALGGDWTADS